MTATLRRPAAGLAWLAGAVLVACLGLTAPSGRAASDETPTEAGASCAPGEHRLALANGQRAVMRVAGGDRPKALLLVLHGAGGSAEDGLRAFRAGWSSPGLVIVAPPSRGKTWSFLQGRGDDLATVDQALTQAFARCTIDPERVGIGGFSDGATFALSLGVRNGGLFHAIVALSPGGIVGDKRTGKPRIFISHGTKDDVVPFSRTRNDLVPRLRRAGYAVTFRSFVGGHSAPQAISRVAVHWFLSRP